VNRGSQRHELRTNTKQAEPHCVQLCRVNVEITFNTLLNHHHDTNQSTTIHPLGPYSVQSVGATSTVSLAIGYNPGRVTTPTQDTNKVALILSTSEG